MDELEMLEARAIAGDVDAMQELIVLHTRDGNYDEAMEWADKAAETGDPNGRRRSILLHTIKMGDAIRDKEWDDIHDHAHTICFHSIRLVMAQRQGELHLTADDLGELSTYFGEARYYYAASILMQENGNMTEALAHMAGVTDVRDRLLLQLLLALSEDQEWDMDEMLDCLCDKQYMTGERNPVQQCVIGMAAVIVATEMEQNGHAKQAVEILDSIISLLTDEDALHGLRQERSHYRKRLFGGWKYVE